MVSPQIRYLRDVLGINTVLLPQDFLADSVGAFEKPGGPKTQSNVPMVWAVDSELTPDAHGLFSKMIAAMNLDSRSVELEVVGAGDWKYALRKHPKVLVLSGAAFGARGRTFQDQETFVVITHSPEELISHPEWKRAAWADLKKIMEVLG